MARTGDNDETARGAALRASKDRLSAMVAGVAEGRGLRVLIGGGNVFAIHGLISPRVAPAAGVVVAPSDLVAMVRVLRDLDWVIERPRRALSPLPNAITHLAHADWPCNLNLHSVIPGLFSDPELVFDALWDARGTAELHDTTVPILDKIATVMFAAHDRLNGDRPTPKTETSLDYFIDQFRTVLTTRECRQLSDLVQLAGGGQELRPLFEGLGISPGPVALPSDEYVRARLALETATFEDWYVLAYLELPVDQRAKLLRHYLPSSPRAVLRGIPAGFASFARVRSAQRRLDARLEA